MQLDLRGKRALVTGSSSGIGVGIAEMLAAEGAIVAVHGRDRARTADVAARIAATGARVEGFTGGLGDPEGCVAVAASVTERLGGIDILVNNAGGGDHLGGNPGWFDVPPTTWPTTFGLNVGAAVSLVHAFAPGMRQRGWGRIINIGSAAANSALADMPDYGAAKAALTHMSMSAARALAGTGVTVNTVSPGVVRTPAMETWLEGLDEQHGWGGTTDDAERRVALEVLDLCVSFAGRPSDIAAMVCLLASDYGRYITGANVRVDGGYARNPN